MTIILPHASRDGLQVRDLIAELQRHNPGDYTDVGYVRPAPNTAALIRVVDKDEGQVDAARAELKSLSAVIDTEEKRHRDLLRRAEKARQIMRRIKLLKQQRPPCLP